MGDFVVGQLDYLFFVAAFALLIAVGECMVLADDKGKRRSWQLMMGFLLLQGFVLIGKADASAFRGSVFPAYAEVGLNAASFVLLLAFALRAAASPALRIVARLAPWGVRIGEVGSFGARKGPPSPW